MRKAFTLIELLVVIAVLAALLFPVLARARELPSPKGFAGAQPSALADGPGITHPQSNAVRMAPYGQAQGDVQGGFRVMASAVHHSSFRLLTFLAFGLNAGHAGGRHMGSA